jgi:Putative metal-binding motif
MFFSPAILGGSFVSLQLTDNSSDDHNVFMQMDVSNRLHIAYERDGMVYYRRHLASGESDLVEESVQNGALFSLAVDASGTPHLLYIHDAKAYYAVRSSTVWQTNFVADTSYATMDVSAGGQAEVVYVSPTYDSDSRNEILLAYNTGSGFGHGLLYNGNEADYNFPVIKLSPNGTRHVMVGELVGSLFNSTGKLLYSQFSPVSSSPASDRGWVYTGSRLVDIPPIGFPQIAYTTGGYWLYCRDAGNWTVTDIFPLGSPYGVNVVALDIASDGKVGMLFNKENRPPSLYLSIMVSNYFPLSYLITTNIAGEADVCMENKSIAAVGLDGNDREIYLYLWNDAGTDLNQMCCFTNSTCQTIDPFECLTLGGSPQGQNTDCETYAYPRYIDSDDDGFGAGPLVYMCATGIGAVVAGDCDDGNPAINPDADEICDGIDNNCDGDTDIGHFYYVDNDLDGYGVEPLINSCMPVGASVAGDCDDNDPAKSPGSEEVCDGSDNDCDGAVDEGGVCESLMANITRTGQYVQLSLGNLVLGATGFVESAQSISHTNWNVIETRTITGPVLKVLVPHTNNAPHAVFRLRYAN